ncbi:hypothetical protein SGLAM104S_07377 [Streptomyces glaucescens]
MYPARSASHHRASTGQGAPTARAVAHPVATRSTGSPPSRQGLPSGTSTLHASPAPVSSMGSRSSRAAEATESASARQSSRAPGESSGRSSFGMLTS